MGNIFPKETNATSNFERERNDLQLFGKLRSMWLHGHYKDADGKVTHFKSKAMTDLNAAIAAMNGKVDDPEAVMSLKLIMLNELEDKLQHNCVYYLREASKDASKQKLLVLFFTVVEEMAELLGEDVISLIKTVSDADGKTESVVVVHDDLPLFFYVFLIYCVKARRSGEARKVLDKKPIRVYSTSPQESYDIHKTRIKATTYKALDFSFDPALLRRNDANSILAEQPTASLMPYWIADFRVFNEYLEFFSRTI